MRTLGFLLLLLCPYLARAEAPRIIHIDFGVPAGELRALHGVNNGPLFGGGTVDVTAAQAALRLPWTRLHDAHWPNPDVVDLHVVFPNPAADPSLPESYDFARTDEYLAAIVKTGARIMYRLGESIEHERVKKHVHPPRDLDRWAQACVGIVRHYNEGWAGGSRLGITHWEIWNEPENRPVMWTGSDQDYFALYRITARALRAHDPNLKIGGPSLGATGSLDANGFKPTPFLVEFLELCRREKLPLDFFSWHCYTADPRELVVRARGIRALLDAHGFSKTESWLDEWNWLPEGSWTPLSKKAAPEVRQRAYDSIAGPRGAAFLVAALLELQDAPLDGACFYRGDGGAWGLFSEQGAPNATYHGMRAFAALLDTPHRVQLTGAEAGRLAAWTGVSDERRNAACLISNRTDTATEIVVQFANLPWTSASRIEVQVLDPSPALKTGREEVLPASATELRLQLTGPGVALIRLKSASP